MEAVRFTWLLAWRSRVGDCARPLRGSRGSGGYPRVDASAACLVLASIAAPRHERAGAAAGGAGSARRRPGPLRRGPPPALSRGSRSNCAGNAWLLRETERMWSSWTRSARPGPHEGTPRAEAPAPLARRHPRPAGRPLDPRVHRRPVRPLRPGKPARAAGPLHRAARPRRHGARVPGRPQRHHGLALGDDDRDARRGAGRARSTCSWPATRTAGSATCAGRSSSSRTASTPPASRSSCATGGSCPRTRRTGTS